MRLFIVHSIPDTNSEIEGVFSSRDKAIAYLLPTLGIIPESAVGSDMRDLDEYIEECELDVPMLLPLE